LSLYILCHLHIAFIPSNHRFVSTVWACNSEIEGDRKQAHIYGNVFVTFTTGTTFLDQKLYDLMSQLILFVDVVLVGATSSNFKKA